MVTIGPKEIPLTRHLVISRFLDMVRFVWHRRFGIVMTAIAFLPIFILGWLAGYVETSPDIPNTQFSRQDVSQALTTLANSLAVIQIFMLGVVLMFTGGRTSGRR